MTIAGITVVIPTIPPRARMLSRAVESAASQTLAPVQIIAQMDLHGEGAAATRNMALPQVSTEWVAFLDDDDRLLPPHLERCLKAAEQAEADVVYPWFHLRGRPIQGYHEIDEEYFGKPFDAAVLKSWGNFIPVTTLVRMSWIRAVGGFPTGDQAPRAISSGDLCEDWGLWLRLSDAGARFVHHPERTWLFFHHPKKTRGRAWQEAGGSPNRGAGVRADPANVDQPREPDMPDVEAVRLLRALADHPREAFIWPMRARWCWPGNVREALLRAAERLGG